MQHMWAAWCLWLLLTLLLLLLLEVEAAVQTRAAVQRLQMVHQHILILKYTTSRLKLLLMVMMQVLSGALPAACCQQANFGGPLSTAGLCDQTSCAPARTNTQIDFCDICCALQAGCLLQWLLF
jgi:hypothetical protein